MTPSPHAAYREMERWAARQIALLGKKLNAPGPPVWQRSEDERRKWRDMSVQFGVFHTVLRRCQNVRKGLVKPR